MLFSGYFAGLYRQDSRPVTEAPISYEFLSTYFFSSFQPTNQGLIVLIVWGGPSIVLVLRSFPAIYRLVITGPPIVVLFPLSVEKN